MRLTAAAAGLLLALGCASAKDAAAPAPADLRVAELQTSMTELLERLDVMNERLARLEESREERGASAAPQPSVRPAPVQPATQTAAPSAIAATSSRALKGADLAEQYRAAIVHFGAHRVAEARAAFQKVFDADPSSELADNALFWIGETYYSAGDYPNAISHYRRVSEQYGDQNKAPDAVYKLALAYAKSGDLALARQTFQEVIARYPYSTPAASAKAELERIKY
jgi:tol-pal system protein YbgF